MITIRINIVVTVMIAMMTMINSSFEVEKFDALHVLSSSEIHSRLICTDRTAILIRTDRTAILEVTLTSVNHWTLRRVYIPGVTLTPERHPRLIRPLI